MTPSAAPKYAAPELHIAGRWRPGRAASSSLIVDPATGKAIATLEHASDDDLDDALAAVDRGQVAWRGTPPRERRRILFLAVEQMHRRADAIAPLLTLEQGKPLAQATAEIEHAAAMVQWYAEQIGRPKGRILDGSLAGTEIEVRREPVGPCLLMSPWNAPVLLAARKLGGALSAGCSCILKPAEETPRAIAEVVRCFVDAGLPEGVVNLVYGVPERVSTRLIASDAIRKVSFTGSVSVGRQLARLAGGSLKRLTLELGGHAPVIVLPDADLESAARQLVAMKFRNAGQLCLSPTRFFVHRDVYIPFVDRFCAHTEALKVGHGLDPATRMGPLANARRLEAMAELISRNAAMSTVALGGRRLGDGGYFFAPTVLIDVRPAAPAMRDEPFGPIALMASVESVEQAIEQANSTRLGLSAYVYTDSAQHQKALVEGLDVGSVAINCTATSSAEAPFGGVKDSGYGCESGDEGFDSYLRTKSIHRAFA